MVPDGLDTRLGGVRFEQTLMPAFPDRGCLPTATGEGCILRPMKGVLCVVTLMVVQGGMGADCYTVGRPLIVCGPGNTYCSCAYVGAECPGSLTLCESTWTASTGSDTETAFGMTFCYTTQACGSQNPGGCYPGVNDCVTSGPVTYVGTFQVAVVIGPCGGEPH